MGPRGPWGPHLRRSLCFIRAASFCVLEHMAYDSQSSLPYHPPWAAPMEARPKASQNKVPEAPLPHR